MLPTLALIRAEKVEDYVVGFQDLGNTDEFDTVLLEQRLAKADIIDYEWAAQKPQTGEGSGVRKGGKYVTTGSDEDSDFD